MMQTFERVPDHTLATSRRYRIDAAGAFLADQPATMPIVESDKIIGGLSLANAMLMVRLT